LDPETGLAVSPNNSPPCYDYRMTNPMTRILLALVVLATLATEASAQSTTRSFYNSIGQSLGRATTSGNTTTFRDSSGRTTGRATTKET
jgi:hypothetical protein